MTPAESVGADLIKRYRTESGFNGVFVDGPTLVRLVMKGGKVDTPQPNDGVTIVVESTTFSFEELLVAARRLDKQNPKSYGTTIESDKSRLIMNLAPTAPLRVDGSIFVDKTAVDPLIDVVASILLTLPNWTQQKAAACPTGTDAPPASGITDRSSALHRTALTTSGTSTEWPLLGRPTTATSTTKPEPATATTQARRCKVCRFGVDKEMSAMEPKFTSGVQQPSGRTPRWDISPRVRFRAMFSCICSTGEAA